MNTQPPASLLNFQRAYSRRVRAPQHQPLPEGIPANRSQVYEQLLANNIFGFINKCFPVAKGLLNAEEWSQLCRKFYAHWHCTTPIFSRIPHQFVEYISHEQEELAVPPWLAELLHYEWLELAVDLDEARVSRVHLLTDPLQQLEVNPTLQLQQYQWPVHKIGAQFIPGECEPVILCVYRTYELEVRFTEINAVTAQLLQLLQQQPRSSSAVLDALAAQLPQLAAKQIHTFGAPLIEQLNSANLLQVASSAS